MLFGRSAFGLVEVATHYTAANTVIALATNDGARLPTPSTDGAFPAAWWDATTYAAGPDLDPNREIVWVGSRSGDTLVVSRGAESAFGGGAASTKSSSGSTYKMLLGWTPALVTQVEDRLVDTIRVNSAVTGFYAAGSNELRARVNSGVDAFTVQSGTTLPRSSTSAEVPNGLFLGAYAKAWGTLAVSGQRLVREGYNVSVPVSLSAGVFAITFSRAMATATYCPLVTMVAPTGDNVGFGRVIPASKTTAGFVVECILSNGTGVGQPSEVCFVVFGAQ